VPTAGAIIAIDTIAPRRWRLGRIGSSPVNVTAPPVWLTSSPTGPRILANSALMSKAMGSSLRVVTFVAGRQSLRWAST
jgi:hypothetical protein